MSKPRGRNSSFIFPHTATATLFDSFVYFRSLVDLRVVQCRIRFAKTRTATAKHLMACEPEDKSDHSPHPQPSCRILALFASSTARGSPRLQQSPSSAIPVSQPYPVKQIMGIVRNSPTWQGNESPKTWEWDGEIPKCENPWDFTRLLTENIGKHFSCKRTRTEKMQRA